jgi:acetyl-CoA carboxylase biotin carboxyl carrier protein
LAKKKPTKPAAKPAKAVKPTKSSTSAAGPMNVDLLEQIIGLMASNDLNTVDLRDGDKRVVLRRGAVIATAAPQISYAAPAAHAAAPAATPVTAANPAPAVAAPADSAEGTVAIKSPMVGTFYAKPSPDAKAFVSVGSTVGEDTDVCVIEAMKVFNNIKAETKGTIVKVVAEDGKPVEFGQVLFLVKP